MVTVDPKNGIVHAVADSISPYAFGQLHHAAQAERTKRCVIKRGGTRDIRHPNARMVYHRHLPYRGTKIPPAPSITDAIMSTATIALPMSNIVCLSTATSLNSNRNLLQQKIPRQLPLVILEGGSPRLFPASHRYSRTPNGPPLCHSRSALSPPFAHLNDTRSKVRLLDHEHTSLRTRASRLDGGH